MLNKSHSTCVTPGRHGLTSRKINTRYRFGGGVFVLILEVVMFSLSSSLHFFEFANPEQYLAWRVGEPLACFVSG